MSAADDLQLIARLRSDAPFSEHGHLYIQAANAIEDANARVALAHADALNAAADAFEALPMNRGGPIATGTWDWFELFPIEHLRDRARAIEVGEI